MRRTCNYRLGTVRFGPVDGVHNLSYGDRCRIDAVTGRTVDEERFDVGDEGGVGQLGVEVPGRGFDASGDVGQNRSW